MTRTTTLLLSALLLMPLAVAVGATSMIEIPTTPAPSNPPGKTTVVLDAKSLGRTFEGIGALSGGGGVTRLLIDYPEPQRSEILDFLFKPGFGASLQHLKVEIGGDVNSTDGTEPSIARTREEFTHPKPEYFNRGYEWWVMKEAKKRNPQIVFDVLQWGAPGWIGNGEFYSQDNADFIVTFIRGAKQYHDLDISYCGCRNERPWNANWLKLLRKTLDANGLKSVKIVAADSPFHWTIADAMAKDKELSDVVQVLGTHYPKYKSTETAQHFGKPLWSSEDGPWSGKWGAHNHYSGNLAAVYNRNYVVGKMTATIVWNLVTSYYDNLPLAGAGLMRANTPWSGHYEGQPAIWMTAHTTQFIQPGWKYLAGEACALLPAGGSHVAAVSPDKKDMSLVVETFDAKAPQHLVFKPAGGLSCRTLHLWRSTAKEQFVKLDDVPIVNGEFAIDAEPEAIYSLTTTIGQGKGTATIPPARPFPLPYRDDFKAKAPGATAKYLCDIHGAFEVAARSDGGKCLQQIMPQKGIAWKGPGGHEPFTIIGNMAWKGDDVWRDYEVGCDVCFDFKQYALIYGRVTRMHYAGKPPHGYGLRFGAGGDWQLSACDKRLLAGKLAVAPGQWHRIGLHFKGDQITVVLDSKVAGAVTDANYKCGMVGLGCGYEAVKFDNLRIDGPAPPLVAPAANPIGRKVGPASATLMLPDETETPRMTKWMDMHYGMFISFNMNTFVGKDRDDGKAPAARYNPTALDVDGWVRVAKEAGMKYAVLTTKHNGGFCLWDSKAQIEGKEYDYDVAASGNKTDVVKAFMDACKKYGIVPGLYYNLLNRHVTENEPGLVKAQLTELMSNYPDCHYYWIDHAIYGNRGSLPALYGLLRGNDPRNIVLFNSHVASAHGETLFEDGKGLGFPADLVDTERHPVVGPVAKFQRWQGKRYFVGYEHCDTMAQKWFNSQGNPRSTEKLFQLYQTVRNAGGNLLLDIGPTPEGKLDPRFVEGLMKLKEKIEPFEKALANRKPESQKAEVSP